MRFTISSGILSHHLQAIRGIISSKNSINILDCFLFNFNGNTLTITASDGDNRLVTNLELIETDTDAAQFCLNAKTILDTLKELSDQPLVFQVDLSRLTVNGIYANGEFTIVGQSAVDYPLATEIGNEYNVCQIPSKTLLTSVTRCFPCTKDDEIRPIMGGILMDIHNDKTTFVATDGHKLMRSSTTKLSSEQPYSIIFTKKCSIMLKSILNRNDDIVEIVSTDKIVVVRTKDYTLTSKLCEGRFPNYQAVIPQNNPYHIIIDRVALQTATRRVSLFSSQNNCLVKLRFESGTCVISGQDYEFATSAEERLNCQYDGTSITIGFKGNLLVEMLGLVDSTEITLELADPSRPGLLIPVDNEEGEDVLMLLMPMMVKD